MFGIDKNGECDYCRNVNNNPCIKNVESSDGKVYFCSRPKHHKGPCVACSTDEHDITNALQVEQNPVGE